MRAAGERWAGPLSLCRYAQDGRAKVARQSGPHLDQPAQLGILLQGFRQAGRQVAYAVLCKCFICKGFIVSLLWFCKPGVVGPNPTVGFPPASSTARLR